MSSVTGGKIKSRHLTGRRNGTSAKKEANIKSKGTESTETVSVSLTQLRDIIQSFKDHSSVSVQKLDPTMSKKLDNTARIISLIADTPSYNSVLDMIKETFEDVKEPIPGTVGAYFKGCFVPTKYDGNPSCSAECGGSVQPPSIKGWKVCEVNIIHFENDDIFFKHKAESDKATIYILDQKSFKGFKRQHIAKLTNEGIKTVTIFFSEQGGNYQEYMTSGPVSSIPVINGNGNGTSSSSGNSNGAVENPAPKNKKRSNGTNYTWLWILIIIIFIILIIWLFVRNSKK